MGKNQWVSPHGKEWAVKGEGNKRASGIYPTQKEAIQHAIDHAKSQRSEVIVQGRDGRIRSKDSYGNDPCPPKDREH